ncbi:MAG: hypothetical protein LBM62_07550 [Mediterranea sp.]|jgi:hypothetical protein|nr:hypothetical protein [Mediterranea sp.]
MKTVRLIILVLALSPIPLAAQTDSTHIEKEYPIVLYDSPAQLFTMRQFDESSLSLYRLTVAEINKVVTPRWAPIVSGLASALLYLPLTHEEGHRSILTSQQIGSISKPYFNKQMSAYIIGVTDADLMSLRNTNLPVYIRLHTAGLESDYALLLREASLMNWKKEDTRVLWMDYVFRKLSLTAYYSYGLFKADAGITEESDERKRDIVGHDVYGAIRHLHRPTMEFYRYTNYNELTPEEKNFSKRVGWRSLLNLLDPLLIGKTGFRIKNDIRFNAALGYGMAPFGDYIDEHVWLSTQRLNAHIYLRQYENKNSWFPAFGVDMYGMKMTRSLLVDIALHGWMQPNDLSFTNKNGKAGGAVEVTGKYRFFYRNSGVKGMSVNVGITAKTKGFLLEDMYLDKHIGLRLGTSIWL